MRAREVMLLKGGDIITCRECPDRGCDGGPDKVVVGKDECGCRRIMHKRNIFPFFTDGTGCALNHDFGWSSSDDRAVEITGRSIKLVATKQEEKTMTKDKKPIDEGTRPPGTTAESAPPAVTNATVGGDFSEPGDTETQAFTDSTLGVTFEPVEVAELMGEPVDPEFHAIDRKFDIVAVSKRGNIYTQNECFIILARDPAARDAISAYRDACLRNGCDDNHIHSLDALYARVNLFQTTFGTQLPSVTHGESTRLMAEYAPDPEDNTL